MWKWLIFIFIPLIVPTVLFEVILTLTYSFSNPAIYLVSLIYLILAYLVVAIVYESNPFGTKMLFVIVTLAIGDIFFIYSYLNMVSIVYSLATFVFLVFWHKKYGLVS